MATIAGLKAGMSELDITLVSLNTFQSVHTPVAKRVEGTDFGLSSSENPDGSVDNYCGFLWDPVRQQICWSGGGHAGHIGNDWYGWKVSDQNFFRGSLPTDMIVVDITTPLQSAFVGSTTPQTLAHKAYHTYNTLQYVPFHDLYYVNSGGSDWTGPSNDKNYRYGESDFSDQVNLIPSGPWLYNPDQFDANKPVGETGTGVDPLDVGQNNVINRDFVGTQGLPSIDGAIVAADASGATNKIWVWDSSARSLWELGVNADGTADTATEYNSGESSLGSLGAMVHIPDLNILIGAGGGKFVWWDLNHNTKWQTVELTTWISTVIDSGDVAMTYDSHRRVLMLWDAKSTEVLEATVSEGYPIGFKFRTVTMNQATGYTPGQGGFHAKFAYAADGANQGLVFTMPTSDSGMWAYNPPSDKAEILDTKTAITPASTLKDLSGVGLTPRAIVPIIESSGTTVHEFVNDVDITVSGALATLNGMPVLNGTFTLPFDLGDLTVPGMTVVIGWWRNQNVNNVKYDLLNSADGTSFEISHNPSTNRYYGNMADTRPWMSAAAAQFVSIGFTSDGATTKVCSNGEIDTRAEAISLNIGNMPMVFTGQNNDLSAAGYIFIFEGSLQDEDELIALTTTPYDYIFNASAADIVPPVITLQGDNPQTIEQGAGWSEPGYTATDDTDGDITGSVVVGGDTVDDSTIGSYVRTYDVQDAAGNSAVQRTRTVNVVAANQPPTANAGPDQTVTVNDVVTLSSVASSDTDGTIVSRLWVQEYGPSVTLDDATAEEPQFTPTVVSDYEFSLVVTDDDGAESVADTVTVSVIQYGGFLVETLPASGLNGPSILLGNDNVSSPADDGKYAYIDNVTFSPQIGTLNWAANGLLEWDYPPGGTITVEYDWYLNNVQQPRDSVPITINQPPTANAGADQTVAVGDLVTLSSAASSDNDGTIASRLWVQDSGPAVTLNDATAEFPQFIPTAPGAHVFSLVVTDDEGAESVADTVTVTATAAQQYATHVDISLPDLAGMTDFPVVIARVPLDAGAPYGQVIVSFDVSTGNASIDLSGMDVPIDEHVQIIGSNYQEEAGAYVACHAAGDAIAS